MGTSNIKNAVVECVKALPYFFLKAHKVWNCQSFFQKCAMDVLLQSVKWPWILEQSCEGSP